MALFQVDGWDLKEQKVKVATVPSRKKAKKEKQKAKRDQKKAEKVEENTDEVKNEEVDDTQKVPEKAEEAPRKRKLDEAPGAFSMDTAKLTPLQQKMMAKLSGSRFRWINEQLYTISSEEALSLIKQQPSLFDEYHQGFRSQVQSWPENPVDVFVDQIKTRATTRAVNAPGGLPGMPNKKVVIADMGCGEAQLALDVSKFLKDHNKGKGKKFQRGSYNKRPSGGLNIEVHSFDLKKANDRITVADIKHVPLADGLCNVVIFCLALMGTNFLDFIQEAYRILAPKGELWIAEIKSRFTESNKNAKAEDVGQEFADALKLCGFFHKKTDNDNKMFTRFEFFKPPQDIIDERKAKLERKRKFIEQETEKEELLKKREQNPEGEWLLKPCIYKRR